MSSDRIAQDDLDFLATVIAEAEQAQSVLVAAQQHLLAAQQAAIGALAVQARVAKHLREKYELSPGDTYDSATGLITYGLSRAEQP